MSFQHFRLGDPALHQPLRHHQHQQHQPFPVQVETFSVSLKKQPPQHQQHPKQPYGSGDADDGYTLVFANQHEFNEWRHAEEERTMCEFVKGDTHGSKAIPPRFKDHTKLVCARHSRSGRKKYIKKHPERVRKVPSRKLEVGCPASISYKTYFDTEQVRACYISQHSHEIGLANLPFTRRGRKEAGVRTEKEKGQGKSAPTQAQDNASSSTATSIPAPVPSTTDEQTNGPSSTTIGSPLPSVPPPVANTFSTTVPMLASLPPQNTYSMASPQTYVYAPQPPPQLTYPPPAPPPAPLPVPATIASDRWETMATLFHSVREHARNFEYPSASVAVLETILIRLYLESPVGIGAQPANLGVVMSTSTGQPRGVANVSTSVQPGTSVVSVTTSDGTSGSTAPEDGG